jgi:uncharacterized protein involved in exopolysaccharide biosynthesis
MTENEGRGDGMEERSTMEIRENEIDLGKYFAVLRKEWWKIILLSLGVGLLTLILMFLMPNAYQATAVITHALNEKKVNPTLGALASFGIDVGVPSKVEDLETLFKSNDLTVRVFRKYNLWQIVLPDKFDPATGRIKTRWSDRLFRGEKGARAPDDWDAIRAVKDLMKVSVNKRNGTISISFESPSGEDSARIVKYYLDEGKNRLQEEAFDRAAMNKKFIEEQIGKTVDALTRDRLYALYGQEVEQEMMARNREQFGFKIIDAPRVPDRKSRPERAWNISIASFLAFLVGCLVAIFRGRKV